MRARLEATALLALPFVLAAVSGPPSFALTTPTLDPTAPVVAALALLAWACCAWLLLVVLLTSAGPRCDAVARRLAPAALRALLRLAVGGTAVTVLAATPALAHVPAPSPVAGAVDLDWPTASPPSSPVPPPAPPPTATAGLVVVHAGDCLWDLAARQLGPQANEREVAVAWPQWWRANRAVIGDDPDLIHPGAVLRAPDASRPTTRGEP